MIQRYNKILILLLVVFAVSNAFAQQIKGVVTDSVTHEPLMYISVYYQDKRDMGTVTNIDGEYKLDARRNGAHCMSSVKTSYPVTRSVNGVFVNLDALTIPIPSGTK